MVEHLSVPRKRFSDLSEGSLQRIGEEEGLPRELWDPLARILSRIFELFAWDEHENYRAIEYWTEQQEAAVFGDYVEEATDFGLAADPGVGNEISRVDHIHGTPANPVTDHLSQSDPHPQYIEGGDEQGDPLPQYQLRSEEGQPGGYPPLNSEAIIPDAHLPGVIEGLGERITVDYEFPDNPVRGDVFIQLVI